MLLTFSCDLCCFLEHFEEHISEQLLHPIAGEPAEFLLDGFERSVDSRDLFSDLPLEVLEADLVGAVMVCVEERVLVLLPGH